MKNMSPTQSHSPLIHPDDSCSILKWRAVEGQYCRILGYETNGDDWIDVNSRSARERCINSRKWWERSSTKLSFLFSYAYPVILWKSAIRCSNTHNFPLFDVRLSSEHSLRVVNIEINQGHYCSPISHSILHPRIFLSHLNVIRRTFVSILVAKVDENKKLNR